MAEVVEINPLAQPSDQQLVRHIAGFLQKLGTYLVHSNEFKAYSDRARAEFWAELVNVMAESDLMPSVWSNPHAIRFCRREFKFFPCAAELTDALRRFSEPLIEAERRNRVYKRSLAVGSERGKSALSSLEQNFLSHFRRHQSDDFRDLASIRGTTIEESRRSALSMLRTYAPNAYEQLSEEERDCGQRAKP